MNALSVVVDATILINVIKHTPRILSSATDYDFVIELGESRVPQRFSQSPAIN